MTINKVSIVGMGSLGLIFGSLLMDKLGRENVEFVVNEERYKRYLDKKRLINNKSYDFKLALDTQLGESADLVIFAVKSTDLRDAINIVKNKVSEKTIIISLLNGITSEKIIGDAFGEEKILYAIAEGMDPIRDAYDLYYTKTGYINIGTDKEDMGKKEKLTQILEFFDRISFPYKFEKDVKQRLWSKFMLNCGVNQTLMIYEGTYKLIQEPGPARSLMIDSMKEVIALADKENIKVTQEDLEFYVSLIDTLNPKSMPSMRFDGLNKKKSEVELFSGTVIKLGQKHGVPTPVNKAIYDRIIEMESRY